MKCNGFPNKTGATPVSASWREISPPQDRVIAVSNDEIPEFGKTASRRVKYRRSEDEFLTEFHGTFEECLQMTSWFGCTLTMPIYSGQRPAVAWDPIYERTILAWTHQSRDDSSLDRQVRVSIGIKGHYTVPQSDRWNIKSMIPPAVACRPTKLDGFSCLLGYVDQSDPELNVVFKRFYITQGSHRYHTARETGSHPIGVNIRTASPIALWYSSNNYWVAIRPTRANQLLEIYRSSNGIQWVSVG